MQQVSSPSPPELSILLPTYNERENLPLVLWLVYKHLTARCVRVNNWQEGAGKREDEEYGLCDDSTETQGVSPPVVCVCTGRTHTSPRNR